MNRLVIANYSRLRKLLFFFPLFLLSFISFILYTIKALSINEYTSIQEESFLFINLYLANYPKLLYNLTQFGDALIFLSLLSIFIIYAPKIWESLITSSIFSLLFSVTLKNTFAIPRPAAIIDPNTFNIIGEKLSGSNSFPSGHSITVFTVITVLMFSFMPKRLLNKIIFFTIISLFGIVFAFTRVCVGAHYPIDVIVGCILGYLAGLLGTFITRKYQLWNWVYNKKYYPILITIMLICCCVLINRIVKENLIIYYLAITSLSITIYKSYSRYVKK